MDTITAWFDRQDWPRIGRWTLALTVLWPLQYGLLAMTAMFVIPLALYLSRRTVRAVTARPGLSAAAGAAAGAAIYAHRHEARNTATAATQGGGNLLRNLLSPFALNWVRYGTPAPAPPALPPPLPATCPHGLSLELCEDPVGHYPPDDIEF